MRYFIYLLAASFLFAIASPVQANQSTVTYTASNAAIANPERGFYRYVESRASQSLSDRRWTQSDFEVPITWVSELEEDDITLLYCIFYLDSYVNSDTIAQSFLDDIAYNLQQVVASGRKCIVRFAYMSDDSDNNGNGTPDVLEDANWLTEPPKARLLGHISQLASTLAVNSDGIATVQAGFIGIWGEWYYTDHFVDPGSQPWEISPEMFANRMEVLTALLNALPDHMQVAVRYPNAKMQMFGTQTPVDASTAYDGSLFSRVSAHNDAILNSWGDSGTYRYDSGNPPGSAYHLDRGFLSAETIYTVNGGETNYPDTGGPGYPSRDCTTTQNELALFHYTYLNTDYYTPALQGWSTGNCLDEIRDNLGYRLQLISGTYDDTTPENGTLNLSINLRNVGYAAPFNPRPVQLIFRDSTRDIAVHTATIDTDPRFWLAGATQTINAAVDLPAAVTEGTYDLLLHLPDQSATLAANPAFAIQFANQNTWEPTTGYNDLQHTITITPENPTAVGLISAETTPIHLPILFILITLTLLTTAKLTPKFHRQSNNNSKFAIHH